MAVLEIFIFATIVCRQRIWRIFMIKNFSDKKLVSEAKRLVGEERKVLVSILTLLQEIERRKLFSDFKCSSLFDFCVKELGYSESQAQRRILAMRLVRDFPEVEEKIASGALSLTNAANAQALFQRARRIGKSVAEQEILKRLEGKASREVEIILAEILPNPMAKLREGTRSLGNGEVELRVVITESTLRKLERLRGLLVHKKGALSNAELITLLSEEALARYIPKSPEGDSAVLSAPKVKAPGLRKYIPIHIRRKIWQEAEGRCTNCQGTFALENDHIELIAKGGGNEPENLRLLCRNCNQRMAIRALNKVWWPNGNKETGGKGEVPLL